MPKYYNYDKILKRYRVSRTINRKRISYGTYKTEKEAQLVVQELEKHDWDREKLYSIRESLGIQNIRRL